MAYSSPPTQSTGDVIGATQWNRLGSNDQWLAESSSTGRPMCKVTRSSDQTIAHATQTAIAWNVNSLDNAASHSTTVNNSRLIAPTAGWYRVVANLKWFNNLTGARVANITQGGAGFPDGEDAILAYSIFNAVHIVEAYVHLAVAEYVEVFGIQASGGNLALLTNSWAWFEWIATY